MMQPSETTKGISLHIGLNAVDPVHYQGWLGELNACEADAKDMKAIAESRGFAAHSLLTAQATRKNVIESITSAAKALSPRDIFFLSYSGHGGRVPDLNWDEDDQEDETWCLYDAEFVDDELYKLLGLFQSGVRIIVLSDSCHSGTVVKKVTKRLVKEMTENGMIEKIVTEVTTVDVTKPGYRVMPKNVAFLVYSANKAFYDPILKDTSLKEAQKKVQSSVLLLSACQDNQLAKDGTFNGLFTGKLRRVWQDGSFVGTYKEFHAAIVKDMPQNQTPNYFTAGETNHAFEGQVPFTIAFP